MPKFKDGAGREWDVPLNIGSIGRVRNRTDINLCDALDGKLMAELGADPLKFASVLWWLLQPQAEKAGVGAEDLAESLSGDSLEQAYQAFCEGLVLFFQKPDQRELLGKLKTKADQVTKRAYGHALSLIESDMVKAKIDREMTKAVEQAESMLGS